ncbi:MAG TPA: AbrB/MazE/SpoVT family DNA-binding domain-containing protein [Thermoanaerobaculia bacterium]|nr:AbrB/MazE/SpoVT family DNA-binding domain-containing protein [Thermoanaerobaculia bacterium]
MALPQSKVTSQGQISVPAEIRRKLGVGPGSVLEWEEEGDHVIVRRAGLYSSEDIHRAVFSRVPKRRSADEFKRGIAERMRRKYARR